MSLLHCPPYSLQGEGGRGAYGATGTTQRAGRTVESECRLRPAGSAEDAGWTACSISSEFLEVAPSTGTVSKASPCIETCRPRPCPGPSPQPPVARCTSTAPPRALRWTRCILHPYLLHPA